MASDRKHTTPDFADFQRYYANEMSATERHRFEKKLLDNPFIADAYEGYLSMLSNAGLDRTRISSELKDALQKRIHPRRRKISPLWTSATAAGIVVALGAGWLIFSNENPASISEANTNKTSYSTAQPPAEISQENPTIASVKSKGHQSQKPTALSDEKPVKKTVRGKFATGPQLAAVDGAALDRTVSDETTPSGAASSETLSNATPVALKKKSFMVREIPDATNNLMDTDSSPRSDRPLTGRILNETGNALQRVKVSYGPSKAPLITFTDSSGTFQIFSHPGDTLRLSVLGYQTKQLVATKSNLANISLEADPQTLAEVVVVGYGTQKKASSYIRGLGKSNTLEPTREASPTSGWTDYMKYLINRTINQGVEGTVAVSFTVSNNGKLKNIKAVGPRNLRKKAIALLRSGPEWLPAYENGKPIASKIELPLQFKK